MENDDARGGVGAVGWGFTSHSRKVRAVLARWRAKSATPQKCNTLACEHPDLHKRLYRRSSILYVVAELRQGAFR